MAKSELSVLGACGQLMAWAGLGSSAVCEALFGKTLVKSESLPRGVMTMTLSGNLDAGLLVRLCFLVGSRVGCGGVPNVSALVHCTGFRPVPLQMNRSILFYFFK